MDKESSCNAGDTGDIGSIPGLGRSPSEGIGNSLQYSCLKNHLDRGAWWATVQSITESATTEPLSTGMSFIHANVTYFAIMFSEPPAVCMCMYIFTYITQKYICYVCA